MIRAILAAVGLLLLSSNVMAQVIPNGTYALINKHSNLAMDVYEMSTADAANIVQWEYWGGAGQKFTFTYLGSGYYSVLNVNSGKSLDVWEQSSDDGAEIDQWTYWGGEGQQWLLTNEGGGYFSLRSKLNGKAIDLWEWSTSNGGDIRQYTYTGADNQLWLLMPTGGSITGSDCIPSGSQSVSSTIVVSSGSYDGGCKIFNPTSALGDGSQDEDQDPAFRVENGATLSNVIIGDNGVDGIHVYSGGTLNNIRWSNVGEDAMTIKSSGTVYANNIEAYDGSDKFIQVNATSTLYVNNCLVDNMGKFLRQNGGTTFAITVNANLCRISNMDEGIFRTDSSSSKATLTNSLIHDTGTTCIGSWNSCSTSNVTSY